MVKQYDDDDDDDDDDVSELLHGQQIYWKSTSAKVFPQKFPILFRITFLYETSE